MLQIFSTRLRFYIIYFSWYNLFVSYIDTLIQIATVIHLKNNNFLINILNLSGLFLFLIFVTSFFGSIYDNMNKCFIYTEDLQSSGLIKLNSFEIIKFYCFWWRSLEAVFFNVSPFIRFTKNCILSIKVDNFVGSMYWCGCGTCCWKWCCHSRACKGSLTT